MITEFSTSCICYAKYYYIVNTVRYLTDVATQYMEQKIGLNSLFIKTVKFANFYDKQYNMFCFF